MTKYAVIDVETTGLGSSDRIVEIAVVVIDHDTRQVVDEFDTLVQPDRGVGPTHVHGISASMVEAAPTFDDIAGSLTRVLGGSVLVAHNLPFDRRFIVDEFTRAGVGIDPGEGICTLRWSGERLDLACQRLGIELSHHHRALADARATGGLLLALLEAWERDIDRIGTADAGISPVTFMTRRDPGVPRTLRRDALVAESRVTASPLTASPAMVSPGVEAAPISAMTLRPSRFRVRYPTADEAAMGYLNIVDAYLDDLVLDEAEHGSLDALADLYGLDRTTRDRLHRDYLAALVEAAQRDGLVSERELSLIASVARALGISDTAFGPLESAYPSDA